ncbi:hypothetical protein [Rhizobium rhizoryzae]|uniref:hypothetical protein n=1 Tax=Rhizobium rhizoryzae TaxID=451876 RepID=UPI0028AA8186|nr:hypothetical protein [Rhizobium rhizoryzae]
MSNFAFTVAGTATVQQAGTYYNTVPDANLWFVGAPTLAGNVTVVGSVGDIYNSQVAVGSKYEVFDFSQTVHQQQQVLVYGSTVRGNWIDGADAAVGGRFTDVFLARANAGNAVDFRGGAGADKIVLNDLRGPVKVYADMGHDGNADVAYINGYLGDYQGRAGVTHWSRADGTSTTLVKVAGSEFQLDNTEILYFNDGYLVDNQLNMNSHAGQATAMLTAVSGGQLHSNGGGLNWVTDLLDDLPRLEVSKILLDATGFGRGLSDADFARATLQGTGQDSSAGSVQMWAELTAVHGRVQVFEALTSYDGAKAYNASLLDGDGGVTVVGLSQTAVHAIELMN